MNRRILMGMLAVGPLLGSLRGQAQEHRRVRRVGILSAGTLIRSNWAPFLEKLRELGWIENQNLIVEWRGAGGKSDLVPALAGELVQLKVDAIVTVGAVASTAAKNVVTTVPLVTFSGDPVRIGLVASMSRPGGNITGVSTIAPELAAKRLELLRELRPKAVRVSELVDPANPYIKLIRQEDEQAYRALGMQPTFVEVVDATQLERIIGEVAGMKAEALIVRADPIFASNRNQIAALTLKHALPTIAEGRAFVEAGCLASYAPSGTEAGGSLASLVDKILRGANPGDLPVVQPTKFELVFNLRTAAALGIKIPQSLLLRGDVIR